MTVQIIQAPSGAVPTMMDDGQPAPVSAPAEPTPGHRESCPDAPLPHHERRRIAILGTTPSRMTAPVGDPDWAVWTIGPGGMDAHNWDMLYEVHHVWPESFKEYLDTLSRVQAPQQVATLEPAADLIAKWLDEHGRDERGRDDPAKRAELAAAITGDWAANVVIDKADMWQRYLRRMWFSSSISYCLAAAIDRLAPLRAAGESVTIGLHGIDLESGEEYVSQFTGAAHLIDLARSMGIDIIMPPGCGLDRDIAPYPNRYETNVALTWEKKAGWLTQMVAHVEIQLKDIEANFYRREGGIAEMRRLGAPQAEIEAANADLNALNIRLGQVGANLHQLRGELHATEFYRRMFVWGMTDPV